jgi:hypothetical protein
MLAASIGAATICFSPWGFMVGRALMWRGMKDFTPFPRPRFLGDVIGYYATLGGQRRPAWAVAVGLLLVGVPILGWACRLLRTRRPDDRRDAPTFWLLALIAFGPVLFLYVTSLVLPQSVWGLRLLVFTAPAVIALVAAGVHRLEPFPLRATLTVLLVVWTTLAGYHELNASGKHAWAPLAQQMSHAEPSSAPGIRVYAFDSSDETIAFYLRERGDDRFRTKRLKHAAEMEGDHFWVAVKEPRRQATQRWLVDQGFEIGQGFVDGFGATLFPVSRRPR